MNTKWVNETCQSCFYQRGGVCRHSPPGAKDHFTAQVYVSQEEVIPGKKLQLGEDNSDKLMTKWRVACAQWAKRGEDDE